MTIGALNFNPNVSANFKQANVNFGNVTRPANTNLGMKNAFAVNFNNGELSPVIADGVRGNVLPRLYA